MKPRARYSWLRATAGLSAVFLLVLLPGCGRSNPLKVPDSSALPAPEADYPAWSLVQQMGPARARILAGAGDGLVRDDVAFLVASPDESITILAWYARTGEDDRIDDEKWVLLDELYVGDSWDTAKSRSLYRQMLEDHPQERLLGAYQQGTTADGRETWHVGYYTEEEKRPDQAWERGDHLYAYNPTVDEWTLLAEDSGSKNAWNVVGQFER